MDFDKKQNTTAQEAIIKSDNEREAEEGEEEEEALGQHRGDSHQQLSFTSNQLSSRLIIKTEAIYPIEFEHLDQDGTKILLNSESSNSKEPTRQQKSTLLNPKRVKNKESVCLLLEFTNFKP